MKGQSFFRRAGFALAGIQAAYRHEASFRTHLLGAAFALVSLILIRPSLVWCALVLVMVALVLAAELFNTALEFMLDGLHPAAAEFVRLAKDCAAAAVLLLSVCAVLVYLLMLVETIGH